MGFALPNREEADTLLRQLEFDDADRLDTLDALPSPERQPALWSLLERAYEALCADIGNIDANPDQSVVLPPALADQERYFWILVYLAAVPDIRRWHVARNVPDDISWATLADLGRHVRLYRRRNGRLGLDTHGWIGLHFRGALYALGRLQFELRLWRWERVWPGERVLAVHIPESGPLDPVACDASFAAAAVFFPGLFPEYASRIATCTSWLLDDQLLEYLPCDSNIVRFQRRFELLDGGREADDSIFHFVFSKRLSALPEIQPRTTLERAILQHIAEGRHWRSRSGWLAL